MFEDFFTVLKSTQRHDVCRCFSCNKSNMRVMPRDVPFIFLFKCFDCGIGGDYVAYQSMINKKSPQAKAAKPAKVITLSDYKVHG